MECQFDVAQNCMFGKTRTLSRYITNLYTKALKDVHVTPVQYSMMTAIMILKETNINDLSSTIKIDRTTLNRNLKPLLRDKIIYIKETSDKRQRILSLTRKGEEIYKKGYIKWKEAQDALYKELGKENWDELNSVLDKIIKVIAK